MKVLLKFITLALVGATAGVHAHELRGGTAVRTKSRALLSLSPYNYAFPFLVCFRHA